MVKQDIISNTIEKLICKQDLSYQNCRDLFSELLNEKTDPVKIAAVLVLLRAKNETVEELSAIVNVLKEKMFMVNTSHKVLDIVGTGGDGAHTVNISTGSAILAASCGVKIAKHGGRAVSSSAGSADVLEALGINIYLSAEKISQSIDQIGIAFCFSPNFHPVLTHIRKVRHQLGVTTSLNILGPLINPVGKANYLLGVFRRELIDVVAKILSQNGCDRSMIVHSEGMDEVSCASPATIIEINDQTIHDSITINSTQFGLPQCSIADLRGGTATDNAEALIAVFKGKAGPIANTLIFNAAVAMYIYGLHSSIAEGVQHAKENLFSGSAFKLLNTWREFSYA